MQKPANAWIDFMCVRACLVCAADREDGVTLFSVKLTKEKCCDCVRTKKPSVLLACCVSLVCQDSVCVASCMSLALSTHVMVCHNKCHIFFWFKCFSAHKL